MKSEKEKDTDGAKWKTAGWKKKKAKGRGCDLVGASCGNSGPETNSMQKIQMHFMKCKIKLTSNS